MQDADLISPQTVNHRGLVIAFGVEPKVNPGNSQPGDIFYNVLDLTLDSSYDDQDWSGWKKLVFPAAIRPAGMSLLGVTSAPEKVGQQTWQVPGFPPVPFTVLSDDLHVYVFRQTDAGSLAVGRFLLVSQPADSQAEDAPPVRALQPVWEPRYQQSRSPDLPAGKKDSVDFLNLDDEPFIEPIIGLSMVRGLINGEFTVQLLPSMEQDSQRWQVFQIDRSTSPASLVGYSIKRSADGLFDFSDQKLAKVEPVTDPVTYEVRPSERVKLDFVDSLGTRSSLDFTTAPAATIYAKQESIVNGYGQDIQVKRSVRLLLACGCRALDNKNEFPDGTVVSLDFAIRSDGRLAPIAETTPVSKIDPQTYALNFDGASQMQIKPGLAPIDLGAGLTLQAWLYSRITDQGRRALLGSTAPVVVAAQLPPTLWIEQGSAVGFGGGFNVAGSDDPVYLESVSKTGVLQKKSWNQVSVVLEAGILTMYVNGVVVHEDNKTFAGGTPVSTPIDNLGTANVIVDVSGAPTVDARTYVGEMDEVRLWSEPLTSQQIKATLFRQLDPSEITDNLRAYWNFDKPDTAGSAVVPDASGHGHSGELLSAAWVPSSSPTSVIAAGEEQISDEGLSVVAGALTFAQTANSPTLFESADGLVHLYYRNAAPAAGTALPKIDQFIDQFLVAQLNTTSARASFAAYWSSSTGENGALSFVARASGPIMNDAVISIEDGSSPDLCTLCLKVSPAAGDVKGEVPFNTVHETWTNVPRDLNLLIDVLGGRATGQWNSAEAQSGRTPYFDYGGTSPGQPPRPVLRTKIGSGHLRFVSERLDVPLSSIAISPGSTSDNCSVEFTYQGGGFCLSQTWPEVPREIGALISTLNGLSNYPYQASAGSFDAYAVDAGDHDILFLAPSGTVESIKIAVNPGANGEVTTCEVKIEVNGLSATWTGVPREQIVLRDAEGQPLPGTFPYSFVSVLRGEDPHYDYNAQASGDYQKISELFHVTEDGFSAQVIDQDVDAATDLRAGNQLFALIDERASGSISDFTATAADFTQGAATNQDGVDLSKGSALFAVAAATRPNDGSAASVGNTALAVRYQVGVSGGWVYEAPRNSVAFSNGGTAQVSLSTPQASRLIDRSSRTFEAWFRPGDSQASDFPRVLAAKLKPEDTAAEPVESVLGLKRRPGILRTHTPEGGAIFCGNDPTLSMQAETFTVEGWIRLSVEQPSATVCNFISANDTLFQLVVVFGVMSLRLDDQNYRGSTELAPDRWYHLAAVKDGAEVRLYLDSRKEKVSVQAVASQSDTSAASPPGLYLCDASPYEYRSNEFRFWRSARSARSIASTFNSYVAGDADDLVGYWHLNEGQGSKVGNLAQSTGTKNDGNFVGTGMGWTPSGYFSNPFASFDELTQLASSVGVGGKSWQHLAAAYHVGNAVDMVADSWINCGNNAGLDFNRTLSLEAWVKRSRAGSGVVDAILSKWGEVKSEQSYQLALHPDGRPMVRLRLNDEPQTMIELTGQTPLSAGAHYLVATVDSETDTAQVSETEFKTTTSFTVRLYVDGLEKEWSTRGPFDGTPSINTSGQDFLIGAAREQNPPGAGPRVELDGFIGLISGPRLWNRCLAASVIATAYSRRALPDADGLAAYWSFEEQTGRTAADAVGGNNGRLSSADLWALFRDTAFLEMYYQGVHIAHYDEPSISELGGYGDEQLTLAGMIEAGAVSQSFDGSVDSVRLWNEFRSGEQILDNLYRPMAGNETNLVAAWEFDAGSGSHVDDVTGYGNRAQLDGSFTWRESDAPLSNEAPMVRNVLGGVDTSFDQTIEGTPVVAEYADTQVDEKGELLSVLKRTYIYRQDGKLRRVSGYMVGELDMVYVGQVQTDPTLVGFIEGPSPVPSENLSYELNYPDPGAYAGASSIKLIDADEQSYAYSFDYESGFDVAMELLVAAIFTTKTEAGFGIMTKIFEADTKIGEKFSLESSEGVRESGSQTSTAGETLSDSIGVVGQWEQPDKAGRWVNPAVGPRYLPDNSGYALVKSATADRYGTRLKGTGALVSFVTVPNANIPEDVNIIAFPINPRYVKNGTLDGKVGLVNDPDYPNADSVRGSYFKPLEAYALKRRITVDQQRLAADYAQFDAGAAGRKHLKQGLSLDELPEDTLVDRAKGFAKRSMVNTYVWSAGGGFHAEEQQFTSVREESLGGYRSFSGKAGLHTEGSISAIVGFYFELDLLFGGHYERSITKTENSTRSFQMETAVGGERFLKKWDSGRFSAKPTEGKVDTYRFLTFYLAPSKASFDDFFDAGSKGVVDPYWLKNSSEPNAVALRQAEGRENKVWRILHRVTFVSRIPPSFQTSPDETLGPQVEEPARVDANWEVIELVKHQLDNTGQANNPTPVQIGEAVDTVLTKTVAADVAWWAAFLQASTVAGSDARKQYASIHQNLVTYMVDYYETKRLLGT